MRARAEAAGETRGRILQAMGQLYFEKPLGEITLDDVAAQAGVSVQTVLRHVGSRDALMRSAAKNLRDDVQAERQAPPGDVARAVEAIVGHYELRGDGVLRLLGQEDHDQELRHALDGGRRIHREWVQRVFETADPELTDLLVVATDVYAWKLLRRDAGLSRRTTEARMRRLVEAVLKGGKK